VGGSAEPPKPAAPAAAAPTRPPGRPLKTRRLFIGLWPPPPTRRALQGWLRGWTWPTHAAVVDPDRLHLTLHFLGAVAESRVEDLRQALAAPAAGLEPFELRLDRVDLWPRGLVVLSPAVVPEPLRQLHARLADTLRALELPVEARAFRPHVTLARKAVGAVAPARPPDIRWPTRGYALVQSEHGYRTLQRYDRAAGPAAP
jgi:2'-5' RNA ligase